MYNRNRSHKQIACRVAFRLLIAMTASLCASPDSRAEVKAALSSQTGEVDVPLQLQYQFIDTGRPEDMPRSIVVDGLEIKLVSASQRADFSNMRPVSTAIYSYNVVPKRAGNFTVPGFSVNCIQAQSPNSRQVRTPAISFLVAAPAASGAPPAAQSLPSPVAGLSAAANSLPRLPKRDSGEPEFYFGEIVGETNSAVVGELIPIELRYYFRADCQFDNLQRPTLSADRVINGPVGEPVQSEISIEDIPYNVVSFQTSLVPAAPGRISINSMMEGQMTVPGGGKPENLDPFFDQFFRQFPMPGFGGATNIVATAVREFLVRDLPVDGQPANFRGAVGRFTLEASAAPEQLKVGETARFSVRVSGDGNFLAVDASSLLDSAVWKILSSEYSAATNSVHTVQSSPKTFSIEAQALAPMVAGPAAMLVFFNPSTGQYQKIVDGNVSVAGDEN